MAIYCGIGASFKQSSMCIVDDTGQIVRETTVACGPDGLIA